MVYDPLIWFLAAAAASALAAVGKLIYSKRALTARKIIGAGWYHAAMGAGIGMFLYEAAGWHDKPWRILATATLYGCGVISWKWLAAFVLRGLGFDSEAIKGTLDDE